MPKPRSVFVPAYRMPVDEITLDTPVNIWWFVDSAEEEQAIISDVARVGATDVRSGPVPGGSARSLFFRVPVRTALENWYNVESLVAGFLPDDAEAHVRSLMEEEGMRDGEFVRTWDRHRLVPGTENA